MNPASQTDTPSEWSKFAPLPLRPRGNSPVPEPENLAAVETSYESTPPTSGPVSEDPSPISDSPSASGSATPVSNSLIASTIDAPSDGTECHAASMVIAHPIDRFLCQNRKCQERRERRGQSPRSLFSAHWRAMKIGKRHTLVVDLAFTCPDCEHEQHATLVPPEWLDARP